MFESYYSLSNFVIHFSDFIMPLWILLLSFEFCYLLSNFVMQLSNSVIRLYSPLMQFRILLFPFQFCYSLFQFHYANINSVIQFPILLFAFELCSSKPGTCIVYLADGALGTSKEFSRDIANHGGLGRRRFTESITSSVYSVAGNPCIS